MGVVVGSEAAGGSAGRGVGPVAGPPARRKSGPVSFESPPLNGETVRFGGVGERGLEGEERVVFGVEAGVAEVGVDVAGGAVGVGGVGVVVDDPALGVGRCQAAARSSRAWAWVSSDGVHVGGEPGPGEGDVGEVVGAAVGVEMAGVEGGALGAVDGGGVAVADDAAGQFGGVELQIPFAGGHGDGVSVGVDVGGGEALAGHDPSPRGWGRERRAGHRPRPPAGRRGRAGGR